MEHYKHYSVEDFVQDFRFRTWVKFPSPQEDVIWQNWIRENSDRQGIVQEARAIVLAIRPLHGDNISDKEIENEIQDILARVNEEDNEDKETARYHPITLSWWVKVAASLTILLMVGWYVFEYGDRLDRVIPERSVVSADNYIIERVNKSIDTLLINLPDNSSVLLSQNSSIRYPREFTGETRNVVIEGTAFFEVTKDPHKPFYVNAGKIVAKVLGTSFEISTDELGKRVRVTVKSGRVSIISKTDEDNGNKDAGIILTQHEQGIFEDDMNQIQHTRLDSSSVEALIVPDTYLAFRATPVSEVFKSLEKVYGVKINFENARIDGCSLTASFTDEPFPLKLDLICRSTGLAYEIVNDQVTILGKGCKNY